MLGERVKEMEEEKAGGMSTEQILNSYLEKFQTNRVEYERLSEG
jgi:hypothetical protein